MDGVKTFAKGDRVRLSEYGRSASLVSPKHLDRLGTVQATPRKQEGFFTVAICWDGQKSEGRYFCGFLEIAS